MIIVTGGAGFIGSNIVRALNERGIEDILVVDDLTDGKKYRNLVDRTFVDYVDKRECLSYLASPPNWISEVEAVFHQGACSQTTEWDGRYMMLENYDFSKALFNHCAAQTIPFIYASSAAVYGVGSSFSVSRVNERPANMYGYSKLQFDQFIRHQLKREHAQLGSVVGLRYFNVYGPGEQHKGPMASVAYHFNHQLKETGRVRLFEGSDGYEPGMQRRDFVHVDDVVKVNLWFYDNPQVRGIFNVGTGRSATFREVAQTVLAWHGRGDIEYIPFPDHLKGHYQSFTEADIKPLREAGYQAPFLTVADGVSRYLDHLNA